MPPPKLELTVQDLRARAPGEGHDLVDQVAGNAELGQGRVQVSGHGVECVTSAPVGQIEVFA